MRDRYPPFFIYQSSLTIHKKKVGVPPSLLSSFPIMLGEFSGYKTLEMPQGFPPSFESVLCELMSVGKEKNMSRRKSLGCLLSNANVKGEEALGRRVGAERTHVERVAARMAERREETWRPLTRNRVAAFVRMYLLAIVYDGNAYRQPEEKRKSKKI